MIDLPETDRLLRCNVVDCRPPAEATAAPLIPRQQQTIDYMAKDYDSFLRAMLDLLPARVPGWIDRTEADLGMAILELIAFVADKLSYYQDRVAGEAVLRTATQYESVRRLLRLVDYSMHPGLSASAVLALEVSDPKYLSGFTVQTREDPGRLPVIFETSETRVLLPELNTMALATDAPTNAQRTELVLAAKLDKALLPAGTRLLLERGWQREWGQVAGPVVVGTETTTVSLTAPLQYDFPAEGSVVRGNGVMATHGAPHRVFTAGSGVPHQSVLLEFAPLTYTAGPDGRPVSSLRVAVGSEPWRQVEDFSQSAAADAHYRITRDHESFVTVHFGDGARGRIPQADTAIEIQYRAGIGEAGLVAAGTLTEYEDPEGYIQSVTNPLPSSGAQNPTSLEAAKLLGPRRLREQNRAVTPADYEDVASWGIRLGAETVRPLHAKARFCWTGSWTTVYVSMDFRHRERSLADDPLLRDAFEAALAAKKLTGYDIRVEDARFAPLRINLIVQVAPTFFARHVREQVERKLGHRAFPDGTVGFFAPQRFDFGQDIFLSDLYAAAMSVEGVASLKVTRFKRLGDRYPDRERQGFIPIGPLEIARCDSDPNHPERGVLYIRTCGGKEG